MKTQFVTLVTSATRSRAQLNSPPMAAVVIDVGANAGQFSREIMFRLGKHSNTLSHTKLIMFEPQRKFRHQLAELCAKYRGQLVPMAAWTMNTTLSFHMNLNNTESSSLVGNAVNDKDMRERGQRWSKTIVPALDLSEYLLRELPVLSDKDPDAVIAYLKLDVEGAEYQILPRLLHTRALCRLRFLEVEWHLRNLPIENKLAGLALRDSLSDILKSTCPMPPSIVHNDMPINNVVAGIPGLERRSELVETYRRRWGSPPAALAGTSTASEERLNSAAKEMRQNDERANAKLEAQIGTAHR